MTETERNPEDYHPSGARRCHAHNRAGERCGGVAVTGTTVCRMHGGTTQQVQRATRLRLLELLDPAVATLAREMTNSKARPIERVKAAAEILDRGGIPKQTAVSGEEARELLLSRILQMRDEAMAAEMRRAREIVAGEVVEEPPEDRFGDEDGQPNG